MRYVDTKNLNNNIEEKMIEEKQKSKKTKNIITIILAVLVIVLVLLFGKRVAALFDPVSIVSDVTRIDLDETDGRTNVLLLGIDRRDVGGETSVLTDTLLFVSIGRVEKNVAMISLPRDLWVSVDTQYGLYHMKINSVYTNYGVEELEDIVEDVLGMPIHYYSIVDFNMFKDAIDILGGINVDVEKSFVDYSYPVQGKEADTCGRTTEEILQMEEQSRYPNEIFPCRYETVQFESGKQVMDGETALKYVRSRKGTNGEDTDFARSKRQQKVIMAIKEKALSLKTLVDLNKLKELYNLYSKNVETNVTFKDIKGFYDLANQIDFDSIRSIVLDDRSGASQGGLLYHPVDNSLYGGAYVLVPRAQDYSQIRAYVQKYIFGEL